MKNEVKAKSTSRSESEYWNSAEHNRTKSRKKCPKRGKRYSRAQKDEILHYAKETSVADAVAKFDVAETTVYEWLRSDKRRNINAKGKGLPIKDEDPAVIRDRKILATWREHPGYGPSQVRLALKRKGFNVSVGSVRHID